MIYLESNNKFQPEQYPGIQSNEFYNLRMKLFVARTDIHQKTGNELLTVKESHQFKKARIWSDALNFLTTKENHSDNSFDLNSDQQNQILFDLLIRHYVNIKKQNVFISEPHEIEYLTEIKNKYDGLSNLGKVKIKEEQTKYFLAGLILNRMDIETIHSLIQDIPNIEMQAFKTFDEDMIVSKELSVLSNFLKYIGENLSVSEKGKYDFLSEVTIVEMSHKVLENIKFLSKDLSFHNKENYEEYKNKIAYRVDKNINTFMDTIKEEISKLSHMRSDVMINLLSNIVLMDKYVNKFWLQHESHRPGMKNLKEYADLSSEELKKLNIVIPEIPKSLKEIILEQKEKISNKINDIQYERRKKLKNKMKK